MDSTARHYVEVLGAELRWKVRGMGTVVACVTLAAEGPAVLLSGHLEGDVPILVYRVADYRTTVAGLRARGMAGLHEIEIPHGPLASFEAAGGQRFAVYELTRPDAAGKFEGIFDEP